LLKYAPCGAKLRMKVVDKSLLAFLKIDFTYGRSILSGMLEEVQKHPRLRLQLVRTESELKNILKTGRTFLGTAGMIWNRDMVKALQKTCGQVVSFANQPPYPADRHILLNDPGIGSTIRKEFHGAGLTRCAVYCPEEHFNFRERARGFVAPVSGPGSDPKPCPVFRQLKQLQEWINESDEPCGVMAVNDVHARILVESCQEEGISVPARLSVIGIDDDDVYAHLGRIPLSSMHLPFHEMGRLAVRDFLEPSQSVPQLRELEGSGVVHRGSTLAGVGLPVTAKRYLEYLRKTRPLPHSVSEACERAGLKRRSLELALRRSIDCSPRDLLQEERRRILRTARDRGLSNQEIAHAVGFRQERSAKRLDS